jgi:hypothetical protein
MQKSSFNSAELSDTYVKAKTTKLLALLWKIRKYNDFFKTGKPNHRFIVSLRYYFSLVKR